MYSYFHVDDLKGQSSEILILVSLHTKIDRPSPEYELLWVKHFCKASKI
jgi:hypothetical protein